MEYQFENGFDHLESHMKFIFGEKGDICHNLGRYVESDLFSNPYRIVNSEEGMREVAFHRLETMIRGSRMEELITKRTLRSSRTEQHMVHL